ncbi:MAG: hypothetical protein WCJ58_06970 [bacterium]
MDKISIHMPKPKLTKILDFISEFFLAGLFLLIIAGTFIFTLGLNPTSYVEKVQKNVLGVSLQDQLAINLVNEDRNYLKISETTITDEKTVWQINAPSVFPGKFVTSLATVSNPTKITHNLQLTFQSNAVTPQDTKIGVIINQKEYFLVDFSQESTFQNLEITIPAGKATDLQLFIIAESFSGAAYPFQISAIKID